MGKKRTNYTGIKFNKLTVLSYLGSSKWNCICDCGRNAVVRGTNIKRKNRYSCRSCTASSSSYKRVRLIQHYGFKNRLYKEYRDGAIKRNLNFTITQKTFFKLIEGICNYCGSSPITMGGYSYMDKSIAPLKRNGVDRVDTTKGYTNNNCVSCCSICNYAKHMLTVTEFRAWVIKVYKYQNERPTTIP